MVCSQLPWRLKGGSRGDQSSCLLYFQPVVTAAFLRASLQGSPRCEQYCFCYPTHTSIHAKPQILGAGAGIAGRSSEQACDRPAQESGGPPPLPPQPARQGGEGAGPAPRPLPAHAFAAAFEGSRTAILVQLAHIHSNHFTFGRGSYHHISYFSVGVLSQQRPYRFWCRPLD